MKNKIFALAIALIAMTGTLSAQTTSEMNVIKTDGTVDTYDTDAVEQVTFDSWTSLGMASYTDDFFTTFWYVDNLTWEVEIQECDDQPGLYRLVYPYDGKYAYNEEYDDGTADWDKSKTYYLEINACDPDAVFITQQEIGVDWGYGMISVWSIADYYMSNGYSFEDVKEAGYCGTLQDCVITFPYMTLMISMADYAGGGWYYANYNSAFKVVLPGASGVKAQAPTSTEKKSIDRTITETPKLVDSPTMK